MGLLIEGKWSDQWYDTKSSGGKFQRESSRFRSTVSDDGFGVESGRYHLYVSYACPWAHRTLITRGLKNLEPHIDVSVVDAYMGNQGWTFGQEAEGTTDHLFGHPYLWKVYVSANAAYTGRVTVPVLWDKKLGTIVNNESSEIIRMFNHEMNELDGVNRELDLYPQNLRADIDEINELVYHTVNNGVYRAGFATTQEAYSDAVRDVFSTLDQLEERLEGREFLVGDVLTEADIRLFTTLVRFDPVYYGHFKCNFRRIRDYPNLSRYTKMIYDLPKVAETTHFEHIKNHYYQSHPTINPTGIVPEGPDNWLNTEKST